MRQQGVTGQSTEQKVRSLLKAVGLEAEKPIPDSGVDLKVWHPGNPEKSYVFRLRAVANRKRIDDIGGSR